MPEREEPSGRLLDEDRAPPLLDELHQPVGSVEPQLHVERVSEHTFAVQKRQVRRSDPGTWPRRTCLFGCIRAAFRQRMDRRGIANRTNGKARKTSVRIDRSA